MRASEPKAKRSGGRRCRKGRVLIQDFIYKASKKTGSAWTWSKHSLPPPFLVRIPSKNRLPLHDPEAGLLRWQAFLCAFECMYVLFSIQMSRTYDLIWIYACHVPCLFASAHILPTSSLEALGYAIMRLCVSEVGVKLSSCSEIDTRLRFRLAKC